MRLANKQILLAKIETTRGVDASPTVANYVVTGPVDVTIDGQDIDLIAVRSSISAPKKTQTRRKITYRFDVDLCGAGTAGSAPHWGPLMEACGSKATTNAGVSVVYAPISDDSQIKSVTIYYYRDGRVFKGVGCMGNFEIRANAGEYLRATFTLTGRFVEVADAAMPSVTAPTTQPVQVQAIGLSFGAWNGAVARNFAFESGNEIADRMSVNSADGLLGTMISGRDPRWSSVVEAELEATHGFFANYVSGATLALDFAHGTQSGNIIEFGAPAATYDVPRISDESKIDMYSIGGQLLESASDDNWSITVK